MPYGADRALRGKLIVGALHIEKRCGACKLVKPVSEFYRSRRSRDRYCRSCRRARDRARQEKKPAAPISLANREYKLRRLYGISLADYAAMYEKQDGRCGICGGKENRLVYGEQPRLVVDHNHETGKVRALLCASCNGKLAAIENEQFMLLAKAYLRHYDGYSFLGDPGYCL